MKIFKAIGQFFDMIGNLISDAVFGQEKKRPMGNRIAEIERKQHEGTSRIFDAIKEGGRALGLIPLEISRAEQSKAAAEAEFRKLATRYNKLVAKSKAPGATKADVRDANLAKANMDNAKSDYLAWSETLKSYLKMRDEADEIKRMNVQSLDRYKIQVSQVKMRGSKILLMDSRNKMKAAMNKAQRDINGLLVEAGSTDVSSDLSKLEEEVYGESGAVDSEAEALKHWLDAGLSDLDEVTADELTTVDIDDVLAQAEKNVASEEPTVLAETKVTE